MIALCHRKINLNPDNILYKDFDHMEMQSFITFRMIWKNLINIYLVLIKM